MVIFVPLYVHEFNLIGQNRPVGKLWRFPCKIQPNCFLSILKFTTKYHKLSTGSIVVMKQVIGGGKTTVLISLLRVYGKWEIELVLLQ